VYLPELKPLIGKTVEIVVVEKDKAPSSEDEWETFFAEEGPVPLDADLYKRYRESDQQQQVAPDL
jgi:hypothetical protein